MRRLIIAALMLGLAGCASVPLPDRNNLADLVSEPVFATPISEVQSPGGQVLPAWLTRYEPDTIVVNTREHTLYYIDRDGNGVSYPVGVAREGFGWSGRSYIAAKKDWPTWTPPKAMIEREARRGHFLPESMPGGLDNPLGAHALYLHSGGRDTQYRIHGTNDPESIGRNASSGCVRMNDEHILDLSARVRIGTKVVVF